MLGGLEELIEEETGINTIVADNPAQVVAIGTGQYMEMMSKMNGNYRDTERKKCGRNH